MATPNVGQVQAAAWEAMIGDGPEDNIHDDYWFFNRLSQGKGFMKVDGGRTANGTIEFALNPSVSSYSDTETIDTTRYDVFDEYQYSWKEYAGTVPHSHLERAKNQGSGAKFELLGAKMDNLKNSFKSVLNADMFGLGTSNGGKVIQGLQMLVSSSPTTGTVGGINRATFTFWRNQQTSGAMSAAAFDNLLSTMRSIYNLCSNGVSGQHPDYWVTTRTVFEGFESKLTTNERYIREGQSDKGITGFKSDALMFKTMPGSYDNDCPSGTLYQLNSRNLKLCYLKGYWMKALESVRPANQTLDVFTVMTIAALITNNPRRLGVITSIT